MPGRRRPSHPRSSLQDGWALRTNSELPLHELAMTQSLLDLVLDQATQVGARRVTSIRLRIGGLTDVVPDSIQFYLDAISRGTLAEGARVDSVIVAPTATCSACGQVFPAETRLLCPMCGGSGKVTAGAELFVESIEVEE